MSVVIIFDIIGYRGSLQDDLEDVPDNPLGYVDVGSGWTSGGIRSGSSTARWCRMNSHRSPQ